MRARSLCALGMVFVWVALAHASERGTPGVPGVQERQWVSDPSVFLLLDHCFTGPTSEMVLLACDGSDTDGDVDVDLHDVALLQPVFTGTHTLTFVLADDADDGTHVVGGDWHADGALGEGVNCVGSGVGADYQLGLRFAVPWIEPGEKFVYAQLVLPAAGAGTIQQQVNIRIAGLAEDDPQPFATVPLPGRPRTTHAALWTLAEPWPEAAGQSTCYPFLRYSPNIAPVINEIVGRPDWGSAGVGQHLALVLETAPTAGVNLVAFEDFRVAEHVDCPGRVIAPRLELYRTVRSTLAGREQLGRTTDTSVDIHVFARSALEAYVKYGTAPDTLAYETPLVAIAEQSAAVISLSGLMPDTRYYYRLAYRVPEAELVDIGPVRTFHTQRAPSRPFVFTVTADAHITPNGSAAAMRAQAALLRRCLQNMRADAPDFHIDLGDTFFCGGKGGRNVLDLTEAFDRHLAQRGFFDLVCHSATFLLALGNHEGECGWLLDGTPECVPVWATLARQGVYPLPRPDGFFTGNATPAPFVGLRENYYAFEWGPALFVVLDPFWYTERCPHGTYGTGDRWDWTLGQTQYDWLAATLAGSEAPFKFVFAHHVTGGTTPYGRGGVEAARHALGGSGSYEWGGESLDGEYVFDRRRSGWGLPVHDLFVMHGVSAFFHGHDHFFAHQVLDGVVYQLCPQPSDTAYGTGFHADGGYVYGAALPNSGHLRVAVEPDLSTVSYVRAYLPGDGPNGVVEYSYSLAPRPLAD